MNISDYEVVVVIPVGPGNRVAFVADTIASYCHYATRTYKIIILDDSKQGLGAELKELFPQADLLLTPRSRGGWAGLYINLSIAFQYALDHYQFKLLLKLDTDALIIGPGPEVQALVQFEANELAGIGGQYPHDYDGKVWNNRWPRQRILNGTRSWKFFRRPLANLRLIKLHRSALKNGYLTGESVFGGAYFLGEKLLKTLSAEKQLPDSRLGALNLGEDHIFSLLARAYGFTLESLSGRGKPMGCAWKELPVSPEVLLADEKKIVHSIRRWADMDETALRVYFKRLRKA